MSNVIFEEESPKPEGDTALVVTLDGFAGPLDLLLTLARDQKVDLRQISILALAEQYLAYIAEARRRRLEVAADYLVMAAWLAYLKSRLLLPPTEKPGEEEPSGEELAARLAFQLRRLEAMREAADKLMAMHRLGRDVFPRGMPEGIRTVRLAAYHCTIYDLLKAYGDFLTMRGSTEALTMRVARRKIVSVEEALVRLSSMLGHTLDWTMLQTFLPPDLTDEFTQRSALASTFNATLEMAKQGKLELRQTHTFGPIFLRRADRVDAADIEPTLIDDQTEAPDDEVS